MALRQLPIINAKLDQEFTTTLEGTAYTFRIKWNFRASRFVMDLLTEQGEPILEGVPMVVSWPLIGRFKDERLPPGEIFVLDITDTNSEPGEESLGTTHFVMYADSTT